MRFVLMVPAGMKRYRRWFVPGGSYFFTVVAYQRKPFLCDELARTILREKIIQCQATWPFTMEAIVLLPYHLHAIWTLGDDGFSQRWGWIKKEFTKSWIAAGGPEQHVSLGNASTAAMVRGSRVSGSTCFATKTIWRFTWTIFTTTP